ncbi:hypothetical protein [Dyadobacter sp. CY326]|uniref:hypothetical protein n=1 Tax=Dyadobacter sp. CY326 TaxID=2907300 RepID=UPI001F2A9C60|nr:hypothetical protein [Dyadobacter sp. CY326]MCE7067193.1 hypothetical protein [Dyadobacter sp. CY326]
MRRQLLPSYPAKAHGGHHLWRAVVAPGDEAVQNTILTVGHNRTRGGLAGTAGNQVFWMINQFDSKQTTGTKKEQALRRAANLNDAGWGNSLIRLIEATPEDSIIFSQMFCF